MDSEIIINFSAISIMIQSPLESVTIKDQDPVLEVAIHLSKEEKQPRALQPEPQ